MKWFTSKKKQIETMQMLQNIRPTSKATLKTQCLIFAKGDVEEAKKLYDYFADGIDDLPSVDPVPPTWTENVSDKINELFGWVRNNQDVISQGIDLVNGMINRRKGVGNVIPPQGQVIQQNAPLPPINEQ